MELLYISPVIPSVTGSGVAIRAGMVLEALTKQFNVSLLTVPVIDGGGGSKADRALTRLCREVQTVRIRQVDPEFERIQEIGDRRTQLVKRALYPKPALFRYATPDAVRRTGAAYGGRRFDVVHVFRLYMAPFAEPFLDARDGARPSCWLDLDDIDSANHRQLAQVYELGAELASASLERAESLKYVHAEQVFIPRFDRVFVCSESDRLFVMQNLGASRVSVVPNAIRLPAALPGGSSANDPFHFLLVGTMGYLPNEDAAVHFCRDILPEIRAVTSIRARALIVGGSPRERVRALASDPDVTVTGRVRDVAKYYAMAGAVVVPLRAGSGTRIKILEALAHGCPVVSSAKGAEGLEVTHGEQLLIADSPKEFVNSCLRLIQDSALREKLRSAGWSWLQGHHSLDVMARCLEDSMGLHPSSQKTTP